MNSETTTIPKVSDGGPVLFDEDYRAHIVKLDAMLKRERHEVWKLREQLAKERNRRQ